MGEDSTSKGLSVTEAQKVVADFLEGTPLYTPVTVVLSEPASIDEIAPRALSRWCRACRFTTTWKPTSSDNFRYGSPGFKCAQCESEGVDFRLQLEPAPYAPLHPAASSISATSRPRRPLTRTKKWTMRKWGQWPAWSITPAPEICEALGTETSNFTGKRSSARARATESAP